MKPALTCLTITNLAENAGNTTYFLGGFKTNITGNWQWGDKITPWSFDAFSGGEPDGQGFERCVEMRPTSGWADVTCDVQRSFICAYTRMADRKNLIVLSKE